MKKQLKTRLDLSPVLKKKCGLWEQHNRLLISWKFIDLLKWKIRKLAITIILFG